MTNRKSTALALIILAFVGVVQAQGTPAPFGLSMGMTAAQVRALTGAEAIPGRPMQFEAKRVPKPLRGVTQYLFLITPKAGLCKISAVGETITTSVYGEEVRSEFAKFEEMLTEKYGAGDQTSGLKDGSIWNEPNDWTMALFRKERALRTQWLAGEPHALPTPIEAIEVEASAASPRYAWVTVRFEFSNFLACQKELRANPF